MQKKDKSEYVELLRNFLSSKKFVEAQEVSKEALQFYSEDEDILLLSIATYLNLANQIPDGAGIDITYKREALKLCKKLQAVFPENQIAKMQLGILEYQVGDPYLAVKYLKEAVKIFPQDHTLFKWYGFASQAIGDHQEAILAFKLAMRNKAQIEEVLLPLAFALQHTGQMQASNEILEGILEAEPANKIAKFGYAQNLLSLGQLEEGFKHYHIRTSLDQKREQKLPCPLWEEGMSLDGKTILVLDEQGLGDTIQFSRFIPLLQKKARKLVVQIAPRMRKILKPVLVGCELIEDEQAAQADIAIDLMSIPFALNMSRDDILNANGAYLTVDAENRLNWRQKLETIIPHLSPAVKKVGVVWQGNLNSAAEQGRSLLSRDIERLFQYENAVFFLLQRAENDEERQRNKAFSGRVFDLGDSLDQGEDAFVDTAAVMRELDYVVTSDTSTAHLAGAMGIPAFVMLKNVPDWRWELSGEKSYWYDSLTLVRQERSGDWPGVIAQIKKNLV